MSIFIFGLLLFFGIHSVSIVNNVWRDQLVAKIGEGPWKGIYSVIALIGLVLLVLGFGEANTAGTLYVPPLWLKHISLMLLLPVFPLLFAAYLPGRIKVATRHPMLLAVKCWAFAHLLASGSVAAVVLFGFFLCWAVIDRISLTSRTTRPLPALPVSWLNDIIAVVGGLAVYLLFLLYLHEWLFGVAPV